MVHQVSQKEEHVKNQIIEMVVLIMMILETMALIMMMIWDSTVVMIMGMLCLDEAIFLTCILTISLNFIKKSICIKPNIWLILSYC